MSGKADPVNPERRWFERMEEIKKDAEKDVKELQSNIERIYPGTVERIYPGTVERIYPGTVERIYPGAVRAVLFDMDCSKERYFFSNNFSYILIYPDKIFQKNSSIV
jgi:hypothetical protein